MAKENLPSGLLNAINTCVRHSRNEIAKKIVSDLREEYRTVIWEFYGSYRPTEYQRTYETLFATNIRRAGGDYRKITAWEGTGFTIKFSVGAEYMSGNPYRDDDASTVFNRTFEQGIHGWIPFTGTSIRDIYEKDNWRYMVNLKQRLGKRKIRPAEQQSPSPKEKMDIWFAAYKKPGNLRNICNPIIEKNIKKYL